MRCERTMVLPSMLPDRLSRLAEVADAHGGIVVAYDIADRVIGYNDAAIRFFQVSPGEETTWEDLLESTLRTGRMRADSLGMGVRDYTALAYRNRQERPAYHFIKDYDDGARWLCEHANIGGANIQIRINLKDNPLLSGIAYGVAGASVTEAVAFAAETARLRWMLDQLPLGAAIVDQRGRRRASNVAADSVWNHLADAPAFRRAVALAVGAGETTYLDLGPASKSRFARISPAQYEEAFVALSPSFDDPRIVEDALRSLDLSPAQSHVAGLIGQGLALEEIATRKGIGSGTARRHIADVTRKLGARIGADNQARVAKAVWELLAVARRRGSGSIQ